MRNHLFSWLKINEKEPKGFWQEVAEEAPRTWLIASGVSLVIVAVRALLDFRVFEGELSFRVLGIRSFLILYFLFSIWVALRNPGFIRKHYQTLMVLFLYLVGIPLGLLNALAGTKTDLYITGIAWVEFASATLFMIPKKKLIAGMAVINFFFIFFYLFLKKGSTLFGLSNVIDTLLIFAFFSIYTYSTLLDFKVNNFIKRHEQESLITELKGTKNALRKSYNDLERRVEERTKELRRLTDYLDKIREEEWKKISREIHDEMGQILTGLTMDLSWMQKHFKNPDQSIIERLKMMSGNVKELILVIRRIASQLRPASLDDLGLTAALEGLIEKTRERTEILIDYTIDPDEMNLDSERALAVYRILQEALNNAIRHSRASHIHISLRLEDNQVLLEVRDNGVGLNSSLGEFEGDGFGIIGIKERVRRFEGDFWIENNPGGGTVVNVLIPHRLESEGSRP